MKILWATKIGDSDWEEQIITTNANRIEAASAWAKSNGFDRLRVSVVSDEPERPDFAATVRRV